MLRVATYFLVLTLLSSASWAHTTMPPASPTVARKGITPIINRLPGAGPGALPTSAPGSNGIAYNGGPIIDDANGVNVYFIWYGDWSNDRLAQKVLVNFITHLGGSPYFNINTTYYSLEPSGSGRTPLKDPVINAVHYKGSADDHYSQGTDLSDYQVYLAVATAITNGALPADQNGVYFLLTSADVNEAAYVFACGWHDSTKNLALPPVSGLNIRFAWVGNSDSPANAYSCIWNYQTTMSGSLAADGMANVIAHEVEEAVTDPDTDSWVIEVPGTPKQTWSENADLCVWIFGSAYHDGSASDPYPPNMKFGGIPYLVQENWVNAKGGYCALKWDD